MKSLFLAGTSLVMVTSVFAEETVWVPPPVGSHIGGGFVPAGRPQKKVTVSAGLAAEEPALRTAIANLDAQSDVVVQGVALIGSAVAAQTKTPADAIRKQHSATGLSYGELLVANSIARSSGKNFNEIVGMKAKSRNWSDLAARLKVPQSQIIAQAKSATDSIRFAEARSSHRRDENIGLGTNDFRQHTGAPIGGSPRGVGGN